MYNYHIECKSKTYIWFIQGLRETKRFQIFKYWNEENKTRQIQKAFRTASWRDGVSYYWQAWHKSGMLCPH